MIKHWFPKVVSEIGAVFAEFVFVIFVRMAPILVRRSEGYEGTQASQPATRPEDAQFIIAGKMPAYPAKPMVKDAIKRVQSSSLELPSVSILGEANERRPHGGML